MFDTRLSFVRTDELHIHIVSTFNDLNVRGGAIFSTNLNQELKLEAGSRSPYIEYMIKAYLHWGKNFTPTDREEADKKW